jgi:hypothetical protein
VSFPSGERVFLSSDAAFKVSADHHFVQAAEQLFGEGTVFVQAKTDVCRFPRKAGRFPPRR